MTRKYKRQFTDYTKPLKNMRQERFCGEYLVLGNAHKAALNAGYFPKSAKSQGSRMLNAGTHTAGRLNYMKMQIAEKCGITIQSVVEDILDTRFRAKGKSKFKDELTASDMLMKHLGGYDKDNVIAVDGEITVNIVNFTGASKK